MLTMTFFYLEKIRVGNFFHDITVFPIIQRKNIYFTIKKRTMKVRHLNSENGPCSSEQRAPISGRFGVSRRRCFVVQIVL